MTTTTARSGKTLALRPTGRFDAHAVAGFNEIIAEVRSPFRDKVLLDLTEVEFVDQTALDALVALRSDLRRNDGDLIVQTVSSAVRIILELTGRDRDLGLIFEPSVARDLALAA